MEDNVLKPLVIATAALAIAGSSIVFAQQRFGGPKGNGNFGPHLEHWRHLSADDMAAFADARIAALKAGLELTPDQAKNWPALEQALRDLAQLYCQVTYSTQPLAPDSLQTLPNLWAELTAADRAQRETVPWG